MSPPLPNPPDDELRRLLIQTTSIAVVGASADPERASHGIFRKLLAMGYRVVPVNPRWPEVLGQRSYATLDEVPGPIELVNVFRRAEETPPVADAAVRRGARALWLQQGIVNEEAAARARAGGLLVIQDLCIGVMAALLQIPHKR